MWRVTDPVLGPTVGSTTLTNTTGTLQNFVQVANVTGFAQNDYVRVGATEYARVQNVLGSKVYFTTALRGIYPPGATLREVTFIQQTDGLDYALTVSSYDPAADGTPCGHCDSCRLRAAGFAVAGLADPALAAPTHVEEPR